MSSNDMHDLAAAYALDAVDDLERKAFEAHLATCGSCQAAVAEFRETATWLSEGQEVPPPEAVRRSVLERIATEPQHPAPALRRLRPRRSGRWLAAAAAVAVGAAGVTYVVTRPEGPDTLVAQVLEDEEAVRSSEQADGATYTVVTSPEVGRTVLVVEELEEPPAGRDYQAWFVYADGRAVSAGLLPDTDDREEILLEGNHPDAAAVGVTVEPAGGSEQPTTEPIVAVPLAG